MPSFSSRNGEAISYDLYQPSGAGPFPAVLLCQGLSGIKNVLLPDIGKAMAAGGFLAMAFDYRGFGESEGERGWIDPAARLYDAHDALDFLKKTASSSFLAVLGISLGGGIAYALGCERNDLDAICVTGGFASGERLMRGLRTAADYIAFKDSIEDDAMVPVTDLVPFSSNFHARYTALMQSQLDAHSSSIPQVTSFHRASGRRILQFDCLRRLPEIGPTPVLIQHGDVDDVIPIEDVLEIYSHMPRSAELIVHKGYDHLGLDAGHGFDIQLSNCVRFLRRCAGISG
jgi:pimeloyl-ACP methyl ester carboxylesterase